MKIYSKFKDYYDSVQCGLGHVWNRETSFVADSSALSYVPREYQYYEGKEKRILVVNFIGFCGLVYAVGRDCNEAENHNNSYEVCCGRPAKEGRVYTGEDLHSHIKHIDSTRELYFEKYFPKISPKEIENKECLDLFLKLDCPIFIFKEDISKGYNNRIYGYSINPRLKDLEFYKVLDLYTTYQKIEQFLTNELAKESKPNPATDKDKILAHGMDLKWSFRNPEPPKRKRK